MSSLQQYIDLYHSREGDFSSGGLKALRTLREESLRRLEAAGALPRKGDEGYAKTDLESVFAPDFGINADRLTFHTNFATVFKCGVHRLLHIKYGL